MEIGRGASWYLPSQYIASVLYLVGRFSTVWTWKSIGIPKYEHIEGGKRLPSVRYAEIDMMLTNDR